MSQLHDYVADLHIHIGRTKSGAAVKITAARSLTLDTIIDYAVTKKGIDIVGIIDCHVPEILTQLQEAIIQGEAFEFQEGGIRFPDVTILLGTEIEINDENSHGLIHVLAFFPTLERMSQFSDWLSKRMKNRTLSSQRIYEKAIVIQQKVRELEGLFIPAHAFTPFKSLYGKGVKKSLTEVFDPELIDAVELGLSSDTEMADQIEELHRYPFLSNSDAHSLEKMAREYQIIRMQNPTFEEFKKALERVKGREIVANYGLNPKLGKYHQTTCAKCHHYVTEGACTRCGSNKVIKGVASRLQELASERLANVKRPPYIHQIPLEFIPKLGKKTLEKLRTRFHTDMNMIHHATEEELREIVSPSVAAMILAARKGEVVIQTGGGGKYGKIT
ncbi:endonuclease Q family protein [Halalkalibacter urbisdiaboli]|uniref:endonuclease Q family protein n=1 Tax=Halalkalibacter urbisdiaboli TaxID=1960589 RepID=UPI000B43D899|nr:endonuclease Q family protein [Halalkalibacter urbisdiaboli]